MAAARVTAYSHVASFFNVGGQKEKEKKRGRGEMNVRNLKFPNCLQILIRGKVRMGVAYCICSFNFSCYFPSFHFQFFTCSLKIALVFCQRQNLKMSPIKRFTGTKKYVSQAAVQCRCPMTTKATKTYSK